MSRICDYFRALELQGGEVAEPQATELMRTDENEKITLNLNLDKKPTLEVIVLS